MFEFEYEGRPVDLTYTRQGVRHDGVELSHKLARLLEARSPQHQATILALVQLAKANDLCWSKGKRVGEHIRGIHWGMLFLIMVPDMNMQRRAADAHAACPLYFQTCSSKFTPWAS